MIVTDWRPLIVKMHTVKQQLSQADAEGLFPVTLPALTASKEAVAETERALGLSLDEEYKNFLSYADGWQYFHQMTSLLGTNELRGGPLIETARQYIEYSEGVYEETLGIPDEKLLPIAVSLEMGDVFVMAIDGTMVGPKVYWLAEGEVIDTYDSFGQYFASMIMYEEATLKELLTSPEST